MIDDERKQPLIVLKKIYNHYIMSNEETRKKYKKALLDYLNTIEDDKIKQHKEDIKNEAEGEDKIEKFIDFLANCGFYSLPLRPHKIISTLVNIYYSIQLQDFYNNLTDEEKGEYRTVLANYLINETNDGNRIQDGKNISQNEQPEEALKDFINREFIIKNTEDQGYFKDQLIFIWWRDKLYNLYIKSSNKKELEKLIIKKIDPDGSHGFYFKLYVKDFEDFLKKKIIELEIGDFKPTVYAIKELFEKAQEKEKELTRKKMKDTIKQEVEEFNKNNKKNRRDSFRISKNNENQIKEKLNLSFDKTQNEKKNDNAKKIQAHIRGKLARDKIKRNNYFKQNEEQIKKIQNWWKGEKILQEAFETKDFDTKISTFNRKNFFKKVKEKVKENNEIKKKVDVFKEKIRSDNKNLLKQEFKILHKKLKQRKELNKIKKRIQFPHRENKQDYNTDKDMVFYYPKPINNKKDNKNVKDKQAIIEIEENKGNKNVKDKQDIIEIEENKGKYEANFSYKFRKRRLKKLAERIKEYYNEASNYFEKGNERIKNLNFDDFLSLSDKKLEQIFNPNRLNENYNYSKEDVVETIKELKDLKDSSLYNWVYRIVDDKNNNQGMQR